MAVAPSVDAGAAQSVVIGQDVGFAATASADTGSSIVSYLWEQVDDTGVVATVVNDGQLEASFTAPNVVLPTALVFKLTVKDDQDLSASDTVTVTVNPDPNAPSLQVAFPPPGGIYIAEDNSNTLSIFGEVTTQGGAALNAITIKGITPEVTATVNGQKWRADNLAIPTDSSEITLTVEAEDDQGRISQENVQLAISDDYEYSYSTAARAILWDESIDKLWVLGADFLISETEIVPVDPLTGVRGTSILSTPMAATRMIFNADQSGFLVSGAISGEAGKIHAVDKSTGAVSVLSSETTGSGPDLQTGSAGLALDGSDLYVGENSSSGFSGLMRVNLLNGDREILLEAVDDDSLTYALSDIAYHNNEVIMVKNSFSNSPVLGYNLNTLTDRQVNSSGSLISSRGRIMLAGGDIIGVSNTTSLVRINVSSGAVSRVSSNLPLTGGNNIKYVTYDSDSKLFYAITMRNAIVVVDEESGHVVGLAGD
ncbi:PKD domain-containing protein [Gilvimarinus xylanilyticus]|uniref:Uncharacterized protein n=1 Tax=Gilvimarinus xylanilyticus TaxID=2944139 RepID=A0A9X2HVK7_9GAMM|nr:hypothetical protein [Gilvimarinus xylanilyticus]MCP8898459.1 hypothetical protein [Gilvimarinus xylanilyticus]